MENNIVFCRMIRELSDRVGVICDETMRVEVVKNAEKDYTVYVFADSSATRLIAATPIPIDPMKKKLEKKDGKGRVSHVAG